MEKQGLHGLILSRVRLLMLGVGVFAGASVVCAFAVDEGELVVLVTTDAESRRHETQLWVVDLEGIQYLRASDPEVRWLTRLSRHPLVMVVRDGSELSYRARVVGDSALASQINRAMAEKYGFADRLWSQLTDRASSVAIRLDALPQETLSKATPRGSP